MKYLTIVFYSSLFLLLTACVPETNKKCKENQILVNGACVLKEQQVVLIPTPTITPTPRPTIIPTPVPTLIPTPSPIPTLPPKLNCGSIPHSGTESRIAYSASSVAYGQTCASIQQTQTRTCNNGNWSTWSGSYKYLTCSVQAALACGTIASGAFEVRTMYQQATVNEGNNCVSETQNRKCVNGQLGSWSGTYTQSKCVSSRVRYESSTVQAGEVCKTETQKMICENAICGSWMPNNFTNKSCSIFADTSTTTSITQYGITWTFATPVKYGQFVNGDYWVIDPGDGVKIIKIDPGHTIHTDGIRHMNGSMINPAKGAQAYDGHILFTGTNDYKEYLNVGIGISTTKPLILTKNNSLVSTISNLEPEKDHRSYVKTAAVLTCLSSIPPIDSFRPAISAPIKTLHTFSSINESLLKNLPYPGTKPNIATYAKYFKMVWLDHIGGWTARFLHPTDGLPCNYYYSVWFAEAALMLHLDYSKEEKKELLIGFLQLGIDTFGYLENGGNGWAPDGGHSSGRKWPILFAGIMFNYAPMKNIGAVSGDYLYSNGHKQGDPPKDLKHFGEDGQTFYVSQLDIDITNSSSWKPDTRTAPNYPYTKAMLGMPEWGITYSNYPTKSDASWKANYRTIGTVVRTWTGNSMATRIMGAKQLWNHDAYFDYIDRFMAISKGNPDPFGYVVPGEAVGSRPSGLIGTMYDTYRKNY